MAKQEGKGWFAIMLGKHIFFKTIIPKYILDAIFFAKDSYSSHIIADIIEFRINKNFKDNNALDFVSCRAQLLKYRNAEIPLEDLVIDLDLVIPDDQIFTIIEKQK